MPQPWWSSTKTHTSAVITPSYALNSSSSSAWWSHLGRSNKIRRDLIIKTPQKKMIKKELATILSSPPALSSILFFPLITVRLLWETVRSRAQLCLLIEAPTRLQYTLGAGGGLMTERHRSACGQWKAWTGWWRSLNQSHKDAPQQKRVCWEQGWWEMCLPADSSSSSERNSCTTTTIIIIIEMAGRVNQYTWPAWALVQAMIAFIFIFFYFGLEIFFGWDFLGCWVGGR